MVDGKTFLFIKVFDANPFVVEFLLGRRRRRRGVYFFPGHKASTLFFLFVFRFHQIERKHHSPIRSRSSSEWLVSAVDD